MASLCKPDDPGSHREIQQGGINMVGSSTAFGLWGRAALLAVAVLGLGACGEPKAQDKQAATEEIKPVRAEAASYKLLRDRQFYPAVIQPRYETPMGFRVAGKIAERRVDVGTVVEAGQVLATLDPADMKLNLKATQAQLRSSDADLERTRQELDRYNQLKTSPAYNQSVYDQRLSAYRAAEARSAQLREQIRLAQNQIEYTELVAPARGVITATSGEIGQVVAAGQTIVTLARTDELEVVTAIPESRIKYATEADKVGFTLWSDPDNKIRAKLREISPSADPATRTYRLRYSILEPVEGLQIGMSATLQLEKLGAQRFVTLPLTALYQDKDKQAVWVVNPQTGGLTLKRVEVVAYGQDKVRIKSGIDEGDLVVTAGVHKLDAGQKVRIYGAPQS